MIRVSELALAACRRLGEFNRPPLRFGSIPRDHGRMRARSGASQLGLRLRARSGVAWARRWPASLLLIIGTLSTAKAIGTAAPVEPHRLEVDFSIATGLLRPLHGINKGPLAANGLVDLTEAQRRLRVPWTRLHDCHNPNPAVVDLHAVFPNPTADPDTPASYDFRATDLYLAAIRTTGAQIIYRLGESIEHQPIKRHVHPPPDPARWAAACAGIVRHYNHGWASGFHWDIRYWEIWNEPENRPVMWTGTEAQFLELYRLTARRLRQEFPAIRIGGPGFGYYGQFDGTTLKPSTFCAAFLDECQRQSLPLDFFSWHCYTDKPSELAARARAVRQLLDTRGFKHTESHLNEWNYLPDNSWDVLSPRADPELRQRAAERMAGIEGGTFAVAALLELQDAPVTVCNFYHGETGLFGLFTEVGAPQRNYYALLAFVQLLETPRRVRLSGTMPDRLVAAAGLSADHQRAGILVANRTGPDTVAVAWSHLPWTGPSAIEVRVVDNARAWALLPEPKTAQNQLTLRLSPPATAWISLRPQQP